MSARVVVRYDFNRPVRVEVSVVVLADDTTIQGCVEISTCHVVSDDVQ